MATKHVTDVQVLRAVQAFRDRDMDIPWPYEALSAETGQPEKVCFKAIERAEARGYLECGVSLRTGWLTDKGKSFLASSGQ